MTLERIEHKVFASEAPLDEMGQFGSALATTKLNTKDVAEIQALPAYTKGWGSAIISENNYPAMEEMNGVLNVMSYHTGYLYQEGIPIYSATQEYSVTSWVKDLAGEKVYKSLQGGNKGHDLTDSAWWEELKLGGGGGLEIGDIGIAPLGIDETQGKRRYLNGQLIIQEQYVQFTNKVKSAVALYPTLACTEEEWQTTATMTVCGQVGKFVVDDEGGTIRLPKIIMPIQGLTDLSKLAEIVEAGLPNIEGNIGRGSSLAMYATSATNGAFKVKDVGTYSGINSSTSISNSGVNASFDASRSNTIYGNSTTVQQEQIQYPYFIQVATEAETEDNIINEIELNNPFSLLDYKYSEYELNNISWLRSEGQYNSKAIYPAVYDLLLKIYNGTEIKAGVSVKLSTETFTDYDFVLDTAEETFRLPILVGNEVLPDYSQAVSQEFGVEYTAERNGFVFARRYCASTSSSEFATITVNGKVFSFNYYNNTAGADCSAILVPIKKGDVYTVSNKASKQNVFFIPAINSGNLYFYVGETVQNANLINAGRIEEKLIDIQNEKLDKSVVKAYIVETYVNGSSGYNLYSNGYCEQWGYGNNASEYVATVTLLKPFKDTKYNVSVTGNDSTRNTYSYNFAYTLTTTNFKVVVPGSYWWRACGYVA